MRIQLPGTGEETPRVDKEPPVGHFAVDAGDEGREISRVSAPLAETRGKVQQLAFQVALDLLKAYPSLGDLGDHLGRFPGRGRGRARGRSQR